MADPKATAKHRKAVEAAILAGVLLAYHGKKRQVLDGLGGKTAPVSISPAAKKKIEAFAAERAQKWQNGTNEHIQAALKGVPDEQRAAAATQERSNQADHIATTLVPFLVRWAESNALVDTYQELPADDSDQSLAAVTLWEWQQNTDFLDDCTEADLASPAPLDDLLAIAEGPPPTHDGCLCTLGPVGADSDAIAYAMRSIGASGAMSPTDTATQQLRNADIKLQTSFPDRPRQTPTPPA